MTSYLLKFMHEERGAITLDWLVLTAVLSATGWAVVQTVSGGVESAALGASSQLRGQVIRQSFGSELCSSGIDGLRAREVARVAAGGTNAVDVDHWMNTTGRAMSDGFVMRERDRISQAASSDDGRWTRENTIVGLLECAMARRGLA